MSPEHPAPLELVLEDRDEHLLVELVNSEFIGGEIFAENIVGGVPVLRMYSFSDHHKEYIDEFLNCATKYKDAPCLVVDIRGNSKVIDADTVVLAVGFRSNNKLQENREGKVPELYSVGDCVRLGKITGAIHGGSRVARQI